MLLCASQISMVDDFVCKVNAAVRRQEEVEKIKSVLHRLATTSVAHDLPSGWEKVLKNSFRNFSFHHCHYIVVVTTLFTTRPVSTYAWNKYKTFQNTNNGGSFTLQGRHD